MNFCLSFKENIFWFCSPDKKHLEKGSPAQKLIEEYDCDINSFLSDLKEYDVLRNTLLKGHLWNTAWRICRSAPNESGYMHPKERLLIHDKITFFFLNSPLSVQNGTKSVLSCRVWSRQLSLRGIYQTIYPQAAG